MFRCIYNLFEILLIVNGFALCHAQDYCNAALCPTDLPHIGCRFTKDNSCGITEHIVATTSDTIDLIIDRHNELRNLVAGGFKHLPTAKRMVVMNWDYRLAHLAELNVLQCEGYDKCHNILPNVVSGQNIARTLLRSNETEVRDVILSQIAIWFDQYRDVTPECIEMFDNSNYRKKVIHFSQIVHDKSKSVGCAIARRLVQASRITQLWQQTMTCNYYSSVIPGEPVYQTGEPVSNCSWINPDPFYENLCMGQHNEVAGATTVSYAVDRMIYD